MEVNIKPEITVEATIKRANGTVEHLGVIASSDDGSVAIAKNIIAKGEIK